jgi:NosR/NirI family transcriptional regulator, nitrous oxide reductase regulator
MPLSTLKSTRYFAKKRVIIIVILAFLVVSLFSVWSQLTTANPSTSPTATTSSSSQAELFTMNRNELLQLVNASDVEFTHSHNNVTYYIVTSTGDTQQPLGLIYLTTDVAPDFTYGYNSHVAILVFVNQTGTIESLRAWRVHESWGYLVTQDYLNEFVDRSVYDPLEVGRDVNGLTSATYTARAIASGVREAGRRVVDDYKASQIRKVGPLEQYLASAAAMIQQGDLIEATAMIGIFVVALIVYRRNSQRLKYAFLGAVILFIGIYAGRMISIIDLTQLMWATFPPLFSNLYWYALFGSMLVTSLVLGRLYCGYICPFGAFIQIIHKISPIKRIIPMKTHSKLVYIKYPILAGVAAGVLLGDSWITGIEPFQIFFRLRGDWWMWIVMVAAVVVSVPFNRFYCSYVCPAGAVMSLAGRLRVREIKRWPECDRCKICEHTCPERAIVGPKISVLECMNCRECEKNYLDAEICPHYAAEKLNSQKDLSSVQLRIPFPSESPSSQAGS